MSTMRQLLEYQADQIEMLLMAHKIYGRVVGGTVLPRLIRHYISLAPGEKPEAVERLAKSIAHRLHVQAARIDQDTDGRVVIEVPRPDRHDITLQALSRLRIPRHTAILGLSVEDGTPLLLHIPSADVAHVLVAGITGSGKTELARTIVASMAMRNRPSELQMVLVDPKARKFGDMAWLPHLLLGEITTDPEDVLDVLQMLTAVMLQRDRDNVTMPRILVVIDELADLVATGGQEFQEDTQRLLQRGREAGIHILACTQKPTVDAIGSLVKSNFPVRLVGSVANPEDAKVATGIAGTGAEKLMGRGDFILVRQGLTHRFQAAIVTREFILHLERTLSQAGRSKIIDQPGGTSPLATYRQERSLRSLLRIIPGGRRRDQRDAQRVVADADFVAHYWDPGRKELAYGHQTAIGDIISAKNSGNGRERIIRVAAIATNILASSSSSSSIEGTRISPPGEDKRNASGEELEEVREI